MIKKQTVLGVYSDSGLNALELSLLQTDGIDLFEKAPSVSRPYPAELKEDLFQFILSGDFSNHQKTQELNNKLTQFHIETIKEFLNQQKRTYPHIDLIGYSGHTLYYSVSDKTTLTIGDAQLIADTFHIPTVTRFIDADFKAGGCGGPLFATHYDALTRSLKKPVEIISLGGILTTTNIGPFGSMQSFDIGIGTLLLDHWVYKKSGAEMDFNGRLASLGSVDKRLLKHLLQDSYLAKIPPKTIDKNYFKELYKQIEASSLQDGAATLTAFMAHSILNAQKFLREKPEHIILIGGGIYNPTLVRYIKSLFQIPVRSASELNWDNETLNAQSYAFLATRAFFGLPISFPQTSGVQAPVSSGMICIPK